MVQIFHIFGPGRTFRGQVGKWGLEDSSLGLNPELAAADPSTDPTANREGQREEATVQASGARQLMKTAQGMEHAISSGIQALANQISAPRQVQKTLTRSGSIIVPPPPPPPVWSLDLYAYLTDLCAASSQVRAAQ